MQNKLNFYFSLSGVPNVRVGWVWSDVWDKVPKKTVFFTPSLRKVQIWRKGAFGSFSVHQKIPSVLS